MHLIALIATLSLGAIDPGPRAGWLTQAPAATSQVADRELTIKAVRDELADLEDRRSAIGYVFPSICIAVGITGIVGSTQLKSGVEWLPTALLVAGTVITSASVVWLLVRIVRSVSLSSDISAKEEQLRALEAQRVQVSLMALPGGVFAGLRLQL